MKLLIAEDDIFFRRLVQKVLSRDHEVIVTGDGNEAWAALQLPAAPRLAILDWVMPGVNGPEICRRVRQSADLSSMYLILFTARNSSADIVSGLRAGADDYVTKPFDPEELRARVKVGETILGLHTALAAQLAAANEALRQEKQLRELLLSVPCRQRSALSKDWPGIEGYLKQPVDAVGGDCQECGLTVDRPHLQLTGGSRRPTRA
jgi:sigma-B regulation protein RsbU (phosphoserine phosphatase)